MIFLLKILEENKRFSLSFWQDSHQLWKSISVERYFLDKKPYAFMFLSLFRAIFCSLFCSRGFLQTAEEVAGKDKQMSALPVR